MVTLIFLSVIVAVFVAVVALEGGDPLLERRPRGLLTWIVSGNWPAKIGGTLNLLVDQATPHAPRVIRGIPKSST
jgi:hypothetical protein